MTDIHEFAPAKINLYLHITGRRPDGYHDLDSLVAFATIGDDIIVRPSSAFSFRIEGPQAERLAHEDPAGNLAVKAARSLAELTGRTLDVAITLVKRLPVASGIGGGSSDAAAVLRALARHWRLAANDPSLFQAASRHGQDVPVCLTIANTYMTADGVQPTGALPRVAVVLVNPNKGLSTPAAYQEYRQGGYGFSAQAQLERTPATLDELVAALKLRGNDFYMPARVLMPEVADMIAALDKTGDCLLARMSGSGATCFGLYRDDAAAAAAAATLRRTYPDWWIEAGALNA
jgi:4-diphosphocytidyl-2-C-methyl-D-erythritol kinase